MQTLHRIVAVGDAAAAIAVEADRMHFVQIGHGAVSVGQVADGMDRRDISVHGIDAFEGDQLGPLGGQALEQFLKMGQIVVTEYVALAAGLANALDHRIVVVGIREDDAAGQQPGQGGKRGLIGNVA